MSLVLSVFSSSVILAHIILSLLALKFRTRFKPHLLGFSSSLRACEMLHLNTLQMTFIYFYTCGKGNTSIPGDGSSHHDQKKKKKVIFLYRMIAVL